MSNSITLPDGRTLRLAEDSETVTTNHLVEWKPDCWTTIHSGSPYVGFTVAENQFLHHPFLRFAILESTFSFVPGEFYFADKGNHAYLAARMPDGTTRLLSVKNGGLLDLVVSPRLTRSLRPALPGEVLRELSRHPLLNSILTTAFPDYHENPPTFATAE